MAAEMIQLIDQMRGTQSWRRGRRGRRVGGNGVGFRARARSTLEIGLLVDGEEVAFFLQPDAV